MKNLLALLLGLLLLAPCALAEEAAALPFPAVDEAVASPIRLTEEGHYLFVPADMEFMEGDVESAEAGFYWTATDDLLGLTYRADPDEGLTLVLYAQQLCAQEGFSAEALMLQNVPCVRLTPQDTDEGFFALLWVAHPGEVQQLQFSFPMDTDDGLTLAEQVMNTLGLYEIPADELLTDEEPSAEPTAEPSATPEA